MELQAIRYASMVSTITFDRAADVFARYLTALGKEEQGPRGIMLDFLGWDEADEDLFGQDVRIVLAAAEFSKELTSSVLWLIDVSIDIRCVRLKPYALARRILVDVQQIIPLRSRRNCRPLQLAPQSGLVLRRPDGGRGGVQGARPLQKQQQPTRKSIRADGIATMENCATRITRPTRSQASEAVKAGIGPCMS